MISLGATPHVVNIDRCRGRAVIMLTKNAGKDGIVSSGSAMTLDNALQAGRDLSSSELTRNLRIPRAIIPTDSTAGEVLSALIYLDKASREMLG